MDLDVITDLGRADNLDSTLLVLDETVDEPVVNHMSNKGEIETKRISRIMQSIDYSLDGPVVEHDGRAVLCLYHLVVQEVPLRPYLGVGVVLVGKLRGVVELLVEGRARYILSDQPDRGGRQPGSVHALKVPVLRRDVVPHVTRHDGTPVGLHGRLPCKGLVRVRDAEALAVEGSLADGQVEVFEQVRWSALLLRNDEIDLTHKV